MSNLVLLTLGSRGDVLPYLALGRRLRAAGHAVRVATYQNFGPLVAGYGLDFHAIPVDVEMLLTQPAGQQLVGAGQNVARQALAIGRTFGQLSNLTAQALLDPALRAADALLCQTPGALYGHDLAEAAGVPLIQLAVMPLERTRQWPHLAFPARLGRVPGLARLSHWVAEQIVWQMFRPSINRFRRKLGLRPAGARGYFHQLGQRGVPVLNGFSPLVVPRPPDWPAHVHQTGYWFPHDQAYQPPSDLLRFLEDGPPPVFIGFGSMPLRSPARTTHVLLEALRLTGQRGLLHAGWGRLGAARLPPNVFPLRYAAFEWLFPQTAAVVHHGGAGTTAMALRAGVPSLLVPFVFDQFFWAGRVAALGVGPAAVPHAALTAQKLATALTTASANPALRQRAATLGARLAAEDGLGEAVTLIERYIV